MPRAKALLRRSRPSPVIAEGATLVAAFVATLVEDEAAKARVHVRWRAVKALRASIYRANSPLPLKLIWRATGSGGITPRKNQEPMNHTRQADSYIILSYVCLSATRGEC